MRGGKHWGVGRGRKIRRWGGGGLGLGLEDSPPEHFSAYIMSPRADPVLLLRGGRFESGNDALSLSIVVGIKVLEV